MELYPGNEVINFQPESKFAKAMTEVFQKVIDYRDGLEGNDKEVISKTISFVNRNLQKDFISVVKEHLNLTVTKLTLSKQPDLFFAILPKIGNDKITNTVFYGTVGQTQIKHTPTTAKELIEISNTFSKELSRIGKTDLQIGKKNLPINCKMYFDPYSAFLSKECIHTDPPRLTAKQIAAIMMHECGHMLSIVENADLTYNVININREAVDYFNEYASPIEKRKYIKQRLTELKKDNVIDRKIINTLSDAQKGIEELEANQKLSLLRTVSSIVLLGIACIFTILSSIESVILSNTIKDMININRLFGNKKTDRMATDKNDFLNERNADEFVSRHGYGSDLAIGLDLIFKYAGLGLMGMVAGRYSKTLRNSTTFFIIFSNLNIGSSAGYGVYEDEIDRTKRLQQNCIKAFKDNNFPDSYISYTIKEFEALDRVIANKTLKARTEHKLDQMWKLLNYLINPTILLNIIFAGHLNKEYQKLIETVETISSSPLYYKAAKLNQLADK